VAIAFIAGSDGAQSKVADTTLIEASLEATSIGDTIIVLFASVGLLVGASGQAVTGIFPVIGLVVGVLLIGAGAYRLGGGMLYSAAPERLSARMGAGSTGPRGYLLFGLTYGIASLSCTLPIFLAVLGGSLATASLGDTLVQMVLYGLGMGFVISLLTMAVALFRESMQRWLKGAMRWADPLGTAFLFVAGMYIVYYWLTIGGLLDG